MENAIREIISKIDHGCVFDSHYIISQLLKNHSNAFCAFIRSKDADTPAAHGLLAQEIAKLKSECNISKLNEYLPEAENIMSWSVNIRGNSNKCIAWVKKPE